LLVPASLFERRNYVVEDAAGRCLPSLWIGAADVVQRDGEGRIDVPLAPPREVTVRVVRERSGEAIVGTRVELLRPWPGSPLVSLRTNAQPSRHFHVQPDIQPGIAEFVGGFALQLDTAVTDAAGRVTLRANVGEACALRLCGPGHQPLVKQPWLVTADSAEIVEVVPSGGTIEVRTTPRGALDRLRVGLPESAAATQPLLFAGYQAGVRLHDARTGRSHPARGVFLPNKIPFDADGYCRIEGVEVGDWEVWVSFAWRLHGDPCAPTLQHTGIVERRLPGVTAVSAGMQTIVEVDVADWARGDVDVGLTHGGRLQSGGVIVVDACADAAFELRSTPNLRAETDGRFRCHLPPGRYFLHRVDFAMKTDDPAGEIEVRSGQLTRADFAVGEIQLRLQIVEADGSFAAGKLRLVRDGWVGSASVDGSGADAIVSVLLRDPLRATFERQLGTGAAGVLEFGPAIELGTVQANGTPGPIVLRLPAR
jgi:hypothetical protein